MIDAVHEKSFAVRSVDIDGDGVIKTVPLLNYILESAGEHAALGGADVTDLFKKGLTWVLSRFHIEITRFPKWGETVRIRTWPSACAALFAVREFEVTCERGPLAVATSSWIIVDLKTRRPVRPAEHLTGFSMLSTRALLDDFAPLPTPTREDVAREFPVFFSDIDVNRHVTATVYVHRALETVPEQILVGFRPAGIKVNFRGEAFYGDGLLSRATRIESADGPVFCHRLSRAADDKELTLLRTSWIRSTR